jgi:RNA polymerase sigma-70 factor (ECF subfamily)
LSKDAENRLAGLLRQGIAGDEAAYAEFLRDTASFVRMVARRKLGTRTEIDAEDIVQETLLAIHLKRHTWQSDQPVLPWLAAITRHKTVDFFRRRGQRVEVDIADYADLIEMPVNETASERDIGRALESLAPGQRQVVTAIAIDGCSIRETAAKFGVTETAVRVSLHRGLSTIARKFGRSAT